MSDPGRRRRGPTSTSNFGVGRRESHDARAFYGRFRSPELSTDDRVTPPLPVEQPFMCGDARSMTTVADRSVALVVTSPPYFAGKVYEEELQRDGVPGSYLEYLALLRAVFAECVRVLEPGGRIAVNVANLGRKPYRSLSADVTRVLEDDLGLLLRGEVIWQKAKGAGGSCAWGSFRSAANPVLRDLTERIVIASKGRFDRARTPAQREAEGLPHRSTVLADDFMAMTLDVWTIQPESARRVEHPAPFPVDLPEQLIELFTYEDDLVLDPFMGSGSSLVAAARLGRRYVGYDTDPGYVDIARRRVGDELARHDAAVSAADGADDGRARDDAIERGDGALALATRRLADAGFSAVRRGRRIRGTAVTADLVADDAGGTTWYFGVAGPYTARRGGLQRPEVAWRWLGHAAALRGAGVAPLVLLTSEIPAPRGEPFIALHAAGPSTIFDVVGLLTDVDLDRLAGYAARHVPAPPEPGFWTTAELDPPA